jgi:hypothetical protein
MVRRVGARSIFALAAFAALAASTGLAVPPHQETAGAQLFHAHVLGAYQFGFLMSAPDARPISVEMSKLHDVLMRAGVTMDVLRQMPGMTHPDLPGALPTIRSAGLGPIHDLAIELALLVLLVRRLSRPTLRAVAEIPLPRVPADLWSLRPPLGPPRPALLSI